MKVCVVQAAAVTGDPTATLAKMEQAMRAAAAEGADLAVFPELYLTGYSIGDDAWRLAEPADGPAAQHLAALARELSLAVLYGYPERDGGQVFNAAQLIDARGERLANHRKRQLFGGYENAVFAPGADDTLVELAGFRLGIAICYEIEFPETARRLAAGGAELIAVPTALSEVYDVVAEKVVPVRAFENQVFVAYANHSGRENGLTYRGMSSICGPDGAVLAHAGDGEATILAQIERGAIGRSRQAFCYLADRIPAQV